MPPSLQARRPSIFVFAIGSFVVLAAVLAVPSTARARLFEASSWPVSVGFRLGSLHPGDFDEDGDEDVLAVPAGSDELVLIRNEGDFRFALSQPLPFRAPTAFKVVDLDGDDRLDLVGMGDAAQLVLHRGRGDGTFEDAHILVPGFAARSFALENLEGDARPEILALAYDGATVREVSRALDGSWTIRDLLVVGPGADLILSTDLNGDGNPDLVAHSLLPTDRLFLEVYLSADEGSWIPQGRHSFPPFLREIDTGDFDGDGNTDLVATHHAGRDHGSYSEGGVAFHYGDGKGSFATGVQAPLRFTPASISVVDLGHDGDDDVVTPDRGVLRHEAGRAIVTDPLWFTLATSCVAAADFDGDGWIDVVGGVGDIIFSPDCAVVQSPRLTFIPGGAGGTFKTAPLELFPGRSIGFRPGAVRGDFDGDGRDDLAVASGDTVHVLVAHDGTHWQRSLPPALITPDGVRDLALADANGDGHLDLFVLTRGAGEILVLLGDGAGRFAAPRAQFYGSSQGSALVVTDLEGDDRPDVVVLRARAPGDSLFVLHNEGDARFSLTGAFSLNGHAMDLGVRRTDRGRHEIATVLSPLHYTLKPAIQVLSSGPGGHAEIGDPIALPLLVQRIQAADLDGDAAEEWIGLATNASLLQLCGVFDGSVLVFNLEARGGLLVRESTPVGPVRVYYGDLALGDFDADGRTDAMVGGYPVEARLYRGTGSGFNPEPTRFGATESNFYILPGDFNADRRIDVALLAGDRLETLINRGEAPADEDGVRATQVGSAHVDRPGLVVRVQDGTLIGVRDILPGTVRLNGILPRGWSRIVEGGNAGDDSGAECGPLSSPTGQETRRDFRFDARGLGSPTVALELTARTEEGRAVRATVCSVARRAADHGLLPAHLESLSPRLSPSVAAAGVARRLDFYTEAAGTVITCNVYDVRGRRVQSWRREAITAGWNTAELRSAGDPAALPGLYFVDLRIGEDRYQLRSVVLTAAR